MFKITKDYFFKGIAVLLPSILTIWVFVQCYDFVHKNIATNINITLVKVIVATVEDYPYATDEYIAEYAISQDASLQMDKDKLAEAINDETFITGARIKLAEDYWVYGAGQIAGFLLAIIVVIFIGAMVASVLGKALWRKLEKLVLRAPLIRQVYPYIKQITDFLLTQNKKLNFTRVAAVEYPRKGVWSIALVTGDGLKAIVDSKSKDFLTVFIPSSPTPFTGYVITVPKKEVIMLDITIEEALRYTISAGVITPAKQKLYEMSKSKEDSENS